jgi:uncharacterized protein (DUF427 family)
MITRHYQYGYYDEFDRTHVVHNDGYRITTYCSDIRIQAYKIRNNRPESKYYPDHPYIGKSYINKTNGKKMTVKTVVQHFGFGDYWMIVAEDDKNSGIAWVLQNPGTGIEKRYEKSDMENRDWEAQLEAQIK